MNVLTESDLEIRQYYCDRCGCDWQGKEGLQFRNNILNLINPVQWCGKCLRIMNLHKGPKLTQLKSKIGCYDHEQPRCVQCGEDKCSSRFHVLKTLKFCMDCVVKSECFCRVCQVPAVDFEIVHLLRLYWKSYLEQYEKKKSLYPNMRVKMMHYLKRPPTDLENKIYFQYATLAVKIASRQAFNVYGVVCTYADVQELFYGTGSKFPYLKATIVRIFYELVNDKLKKEKICYFMQNAMDIHASLQGMFHDSSDGIFLYDYFIYSGVHEEKWCSVIVEKKEAFKYDIVTFLPSESCTETNEVVSNFVIEAMKVQYQNLKDVNNPESPWSWQALVLHRKEIAEDPATTKFDDVDAGIYTIFKTYLYLLQKDDMIFPSKHIERIRNLVLYMIITMDINYGQVKMGDDSTTPSTSLTY